MAPLFPPDDDRLHAVREALPAVAAGIYLDTATAGPLPSESAAAMAELAAWELRTGRASPAYLDEMRARLDEARAAVAAVLVADVDEVAIVGTAGGAIASAAASIRWRPGDAVATVAPEHDPALAPLERLAGTLGLRVDRVPVGDEATVLGWIEEALDPGTRLVAVPHVSWATGEVLPIRGLVELARARGVIVAVDGTQAAGAIPVDVQSLGVDLYAVAGQAWLLGPAGIAALWSAGARTRPRHDDDALYGPAVVALARGIGWLSMYVGLEWLQGRASALTGALAARLEGIAGVEVLTPGDRRAGILTFRISGWSAAGALEELSSRIFLIAHAVAELDAIRLSVAGFNDAAELERLLGAVELLASHTPETLPARRPLTIIGEGRR